MTLPGFARDTVTITTPGTTESRGSIILDWATATETQVSGCSFQPRGSTADISDRENDQIDAVLYLPPSAAIDQTCKVSAPDGRTYRVYGAPEARRGPSGNLSHIKATLRFWEG